MPRKYYAKKSKKSFSKKKRSTSSRRYKRQPFRPQRLITSGFPKTNMVRLRYVDTIQLTQTVADTLAQHYFRANSCFAPDSTGSATAHQPMGWDEWAGFYRNYVVVGSKIKVTGSPAAGTGSATVLAVQTVPTTSLTTDVTTFLEQSRTNKVTYRSQSSSAGTQAMKRAITKGFSAKKFFNITNISDNVDRLGSGTGGNPDDEAYFCVSFGSLNPSDSSEATSWLLVEIEYIVMFSNPKPLSQS